MKSPISILLVQDVCSLGGHTYLRLELAQGLLKRANKVHAFFYEDGGCFAQFAEQCPAQIGTVNDLICLLRSEKYDIVQGDASMTDLPIILKKAGFQGKLALTRHHVDTTVGWLTHNCDMYIAESETSAALMRPYTDLQVQIIPNGVQMDFFQRVPCAIAEKPIIAWCGRSASEFKNLPRYLAITRLLGTANYTYWIADGNGKPDDCTIDKLGGDSHIAVWRKYDRSEFPDFYSQIARSGGCLLVTSKFEGLPVTLLEALSCGCPVIAAEARGVSDVLNGEMERWLYPADASNEQAAQFLIDALSELRNREYYTQFREHIQKKFSQDVMAEGYLNCYWDAMTQGIRKQTIQHEMLITNLWNAAEDMMRQKRPRDAVFIIGSLRRKVPNILWKAKKLRLFARAVWDTRMRGAYSLHLKAQDEFKKKKFKQGIKLAFRSVTIHPAILFKHKSAPRQ